MSVSVRRVKENATDPLPPSKVDPSLAMCLAWHAKGLCNTACRNRADHVTYTNSEYQPLVVWCTADYKEE